MIWSDFVKAAGEISWITYLATRGGDDRPHVAPVSVAFTPNALWFASNASSRKIRNIRANPDVAFHWPVGTGSGPGELFARGSAKVHDSGEAKHRLWAELDFAYDLASFFRSENNPELVFIEAAATHASLLGPDFGRDTWSPE